MKIMIKIISLSLISVLISLTQIYGQTVTDSVNIGGLVTQKATYYGNWTINAEGCKCSYTNTAGAKVVIDFIGTHFYMIGETRPWHGKSAVTVDGITYPKIDQYSSISKDNIIQFQVDYLPWGHHRIEIINTGTKNDLSTNNYLVYKGAIINNDPPDYRMDVVVMHDTISSGNMIDTVVVNKIRIDTVFINRLDTITINQIDTIYKTKYLRPYYLFNLDSIYYE